VTAPPCYVFMATFVNYLKPDRWYLVAASDDIYRAVRNFHNSTIERSAVTRDVKWCVQCDDAASVARAVNDWLCECGVKMEGRCFKLVGMTPDDVKDKAKALMNRTSAP
jgi:ribosomal protein L37AE/L43A